MFVSDTVNLLVCDAYQGWNRNRIRDPPRAFVTERRRRLTFETQFVGGKKRGRDARQ